MKRILLLVLCAFSGLLIFAQKVENIRPEKNGDKIRIYYEIVNSTNKQFFDVVIKAKISGDKTIDLASLTGDAGKNIQGGKDVYMAEWDVLKDVNKLSSAEFIVIIDLAKDLTETIVEKPVKEKPIKEEKPVVVKEEKVVKETRPNADNTKFSVLRYDKENKGQWFVAVEALGLKGGYRGKWGFGLLVGQDLGYNQFTLLADVSKSLIRKQNMQWSIYPVVGFTKAFYSGYGHYVPFYDEYGNIIGEQWLGEYYEEYLPSFALGLGTDFCVGHLYVNIDVFLDKAYNFRGFAGIGWRF